MSLQPMTGVMARSSRSFVPALLAGLVLLAPSVAWAHGITEPAAGRSVERSASFPATVGWDQTIGPTGGTVTRLLQVDGRILASLYSGGIYELAGSTWRQIAIGAGIPENRAMDLVVDPVNPQHIYAPQMIACAARSSTAGKDWSGLCDQMLTAADGPNFSSMTLALDPANPSIVYVPGHRHDGTSMLLVSEDGGTTWTRRFTFPEQRDFNHLVFFGSRMLLATRETGVQISDDRGFTWAPLNTGLTGTETARFVAFKGELYLVGGRLQFNVRTGGNLYRLNDAGTSWEKVPGVSLVTGVGTDGATLWVGGEDSRLWRSRDGRVFSQATAKGLPGGWVGEIASLGSRTLYVGLAGSGIFRSTDGGESFGELNAGLSSIATREVHVDPKNARHLYVVTWDRVGMYVSRNAGASYQRVGADYNILTVAPQPQSFDRVFAAGDRFLQGTFRGARVDWIELAKPGPRSSVVKALAVSPTDPDLVLAGVARETAETPAGYGVWHTTNGGRSWKRSRGVQNNAAYSIVFDPRDPRTVFASALGGGVYKSANGGRSFTRIGPASLKYTYRLAMSGSDPKHLIAGSNLFFAQLSSEEQISGRYGGLFETRDGGETWTELTAGIRAYDGSGDPTGFQPWLYNFGHLVNYEQVLIDSRDDRRIIVGHHGESVVTTDDGGQTWQKQDAGMIPGRMHNYAYCLGASASGDIYACSCGRGLFRGRVSTRTGQIAWRPTQPVGTSVRDADGDHSLEPTSASEARDLILSGEYDHAH